jgi:predicted transcriptional regulator
MGFTGNVSQSELAILKVLWDAGPSTVREAVAKLSQEWAYTTVQTLLNRLADKQCVVVDRSAVPHVYRAAVSREELVQHRLRDVAADLCEGASSPLVLALVRDERFSRKDIAHFRALLDDLEEGKTGRKTP